MGDLLDRELYLGTSLMPIAGVSSGVEAVYRARLAPDCSAQVERLGVDGQGWIAPVVVDREDRQTLYAGTSKGGVFRSRDGGNSWEECNRGMVYKEVWSLVQHPLTGELYAGTQPAAIFHSKDRGETWDEYDYLRGMIDRRDWSFPGPPFIAHVKHIELTATDPNLILAAVEEGWLLRSTNGGESWTNIKLGTAFDAHSVMVMPDNPDIVIHTAGTGCHRSTDRGESFTDANAGLDQKYMTPVALHPDRPATLFTAASEVPPPFWRRPDGANGAFYRSDDQGITWQKLVGSLPEHLHAAPRNVAVDPAEPSTVYFSMSDGTLWITQDSGATFDHVDLGGLPAVTGVTVAPSDR